MPDRELERLRVLLRAVISFGDNLKAFYGLDPLAGSRARVELDADVLVGGHRVVLEAYHMAELRLVAARDHVSSVAQLLHASDSVFAVSALARTALETSSRSAWLLSPRIGR